MLDSGSNATICRRRIAQRLAVEGRPVELVLNLAAAEKSAPTPEEEICLQLVSLDNRYTTQKFVATTAKKCVLDLEPIKLDPSLHSQLKHTTFTESYPQREPRSVDLILDTALTTQLLDGPVIKSDNLISPKVLATKLGNVLAGAYYRDEPQAVEPFGQVHAVVRQRTVAVAMAPQFERFFHFEDLGIKAYCPQELSAEEQLAIRLMEEHTKYVASEKRFYVRLLYKKDCSLWLDSNFKAAHRMAIATRNKATRNNVLPMVNSAYAEMLQHGAAVEITDKDEIYRKDVPVFYMPSHFVLKPDATSTKCRVVFNGSSKSPTHKHSLNDCLLNGPNLLPEIMAMVLMVRSERHLLMCDIVKQFWNLKLRNPCPEVCRFLWWDSEGNLRHYKHLGLPFGLKCSPYISTYICHQVAKQWADKWPMASRAILENQYVDDIILPIAHTDTAVATGKEILEILAMASLKPHKWVASDPSILDRINIPASERNEKQIVKILGLAWNTTSDVLEFDLSKILNPDKGKPDTKRELLQQLGRVYDVLGLLSPVTVVAKMLLQETFKLGLTWDQQLPEPLASSWQAWKDGLHLLQNLKIPRLIISAPDQEQPFLAVFCDASTLACAAAAFVCTSKQTGLLCCRTRVAPIKDVKETDRNWTVARLELVAALMGARLSAYIRDKLGERFSRVHMFSDSSITVWRIKADHSKYKQWVNHRLGEIAKNTKIENWRHIPGHLNIPADVASRGLTASELLKCPYWTSAPPFVMRDEAQWPPPFQALTKVEAQKQIEIDQHELAPTKLSLAIQKVFLGHIDFPELGNRTSSWNHLLRVTSVVFRFLITKMPSLIQKTAIFKESEQGLKGPIKASELHTSTIYWVRTAQRQSFTSDLASQDGIYVIKEKSPLQQLGAFLDETLLIRVRTRLCRSETIPDQTHSPILLPPNSDIGAKLVLGLHKSLGHATLSTVHHVLSRSYHQMHGRRELRKILKSCTTPNCTKVIPLQVPESSLPPERSEGTPWKNVMLDYAGPFFFLSDKCDCRDQLVCKAYAFIATCMYTRSLHVEMIQSASTEHFIFAFGKFIARRGTPTVVFSDNGTNFKSADRELRKLFKALDPDKIENRLSARKITWKWGVSYYPQGQGLVESMVKLFKAQLKTTLAASNKLSFLMLEWTALQCEENVNSRPLAVPSDSLEEDMVITPSLLDHGRHLKPLPFGKETVAENDTPFTRKMLHRKQLVSQFFRLWKKQYLAASMASRFAKKGEDPPLEVGMPVLLRDHKSNLSKNQRWGLARVVALNRSGDGQIRRVTLLNPNKNTITRHISQVALLPSTIDEINKKRQTTGQ